MKTNRKNRGFTLVEILIVVVILGILAAIVVPQFGQASDEARLASLQSNLQTVRSQIELYRIQHDDAYPPEDNAAFITAMTVVDADGFGPYLRSVPNNPMTNTRTIDATGTAGDDVGAWEYSATTGWFQADDSGTTSGGIDHCDL